MATEKTNCADNFTLPQGPPGPAGPQGVIGPQGYPGNTQQGLQGPSGASKIDVNIQERADPYVSLTEQDSFKTLVHFIFPGTNDFTPQTWRIALSYFSSTGNNIITIRLGYITSSGTRIIVGFRAIQTTASDGNNSDTYSVEEISDLGSFPAGATNCYVEASGSSLKKGNTVKFYATELRA
tara:strand:- start:7208 stop:7750 length:543 start_codon:yes stop_codon:yes gene_type:complete